jgi:hypothetical protein
MPALRAMMNDEDAPRPIEPSVAMRVNEEDETTTVFAGTPLWFSVSVANAAAVNELAASRVLARKLARLATEAVQQQARTQELPRVYADYAQRQAPAAITLGDAAKPWTTAMQFVVRDAKGGEQPLSLLLKPIGNQRRMAELDARRTIQTNFGGASADLAPGVYSVIGCLGNTGSWQGRACSNSVNLTVLARPAQLSSAQQLALDRQKARFGLLTGDYQAIETYGQNLLDADPNSVPGHIYLGEAKFLQSQWEDALHEFVTARAQFNRQNPSAVDRPKYLNARINQTLEKMR